MNVRISTLIKTSLIFFVCTNFLQAQNANLTIEQRFKGIIEDSETFKQYKVIPRVELDGFLGVLKDSLSSSQARISSLTTEVSELEGQVEDLNSQIEVLNADLLESNLKNDSIGFLGIDVQKSFYHFMVWALILGLIVLSSVTYIMFQRSNRLTVEAKKDAQRVNNEYEVFRMNSKQKQVKLKRELQTALNKLDEKGMKV